MNIRNIIALIFFLFGVVLSGISFYNNQPLVALTLILAGGYTAITILLGVVDSLSNEYLKIAAAVIGILGLISVFFYNKAFDRNLQGTYYAVLSDMVSIDQRCKPMSPELSNIQTFGIAACAAQGNSDQLGAVVDLGKGLYFGPTVTILDTGIAQAASNSPNYCARAFKAADDLCKTAFFSMNNASKRILIDAAKY
ncbi:hypothetical protein [Comamonas avium]|uniref:Uncharacterized protein n=1 Tax=Comamonas avium TaxID=2762231 RepID=A0ABR8SFY4_9BURK|nr:hypothetical protein [Comamonas avium]MBD7962403.1 hypothetical protein [Comamonas avium]